MPLFDETICPVNEKCREIIRISKTLKGNTGYIEHLENLWTNYAPYAPPDFQKQFLSDAGKHYSLIWEMFLANKLLENDYDLIPVQSSNAPDLCVEQDGKKIWIECCLPEKGDVALPDSVPETICDGEFHEVDHNKSVLRCVNVLTAKKQQHLRWLEKGICRPEEAFIIGLNGRNLQLSIRNHSLPQILRPLYAVGDEYATFDPKNPHYSENGYLRQDNVLKASEKEVSTSFFLEEDNAHIDGVLFSTDWIGLYSSSPNYCFVENIYATNRLSPILDKFCQIYDYSEKGIKMKGKGVE